MTPRLRARLSDPAREIIVDEVAAQRGREVLFVCAWDAAQKLIHSPRLVWVGNYTEVAWSPLDGRAGEIFVHNHPNPFGAEEGETIPYGDANHVCPSAKDLKVAMALAELGIGFAIIDNLGAELCVVREPDASVGARWRMLGSMRLGPFALSLMGRNALR